MSSKSLVNRGFRKKIGKILFTSFLAVILAVSTTAYSALVASDKNVAHAESLADINLLRNVTVDADLGNVEGTGPYTLNLKLTGTGVADVELVNPDKTVIFYAQELASTGKWHPAGKAHVRAELLPITLDQIPALIDLIDGLTGTLNETVKILIDAVDQLNRDVIGPLLPIIEIQGISELNKAISALENLGQALVDLTVFEGDVDVVVGEHGELIINFTDALGQRLATTVNDVVVKLLKDVLDAVKALGIKVDLSQVGNIPIVGDLPLVGELLGLIGKTLDDLLGETLNSLVGPNGLVFSVIDTLVVAVEDVLAQVTGTVLNLADFLATLQVLGKTTVEVPLTVDKPAIGKDAEVKVFGEGVNASAVTIDVLSSFVNYDTIVFKEGKKEEPAPEPEEPKKPEEPKQPEQPKQPEEPKKPEKPGIKLPDTATAAGTIGLAGLAALVAGIAARFYGRGE